GERGGAVTTSDGRRPFGPSRRATRVTVGIVLAFLFVLVVIVSKPMTGGPLGGWLEALGWAVGTVFVTVLVNKKLRSSLLDRVTATRVVGGRRRDRQREIFAPLLASNKLPPGVPIPTAGPSLGTPSSGAPPAVPASLLAGTGAPPPGTGTPSIAGMPPGTGAPPPGTGVPVATFPPSGVALSPGSVIPQPGWLPAPTGGLPGAPAPVQPTAQADGAEILTGAAAAVAALLRAQQGGAPAPAVEVPQSVPLPSPLAAAPLPGAPAPAVLSPMPPLAAVIPPRYTPPPLAVAGGDAAWPELESAAVALTARPLPARIEWATALGEVALLLSRTLPSDCSVRADSSGMVVWNSVATKRSGLAGPDPLGDPQLAIERLAQAVPQLLDLVRDFVAEHPVSSWRPAELRAEARAFVGDVAVYAWYEVAGRPLLVLDEVPFAGSGVGARAGRISERR
ncbi:MAG TPA: hypothetical protein VMD59_14245, partial [Acidimicrobiales bacterium]|nr:hypothetical protein [Acidimicrobiales bacterium]